MTHRDMLEAYPKDLGGIDVDKLADCIQACFECGQTCTACADACLAEDAIADLVPCVRSDLDCADVCLTTGRVLTRRTAYDVGVTRTLLEACASACRTCGDECARHAEMHEHCRICAEACRRCEQTCRDLIAALS